MKYDVVVIGAGLAGFSSALAAVELGKKVIVVAKGLGNLYSSSGYIDFLGYYPTTTSWPVTNPLQALEGLVSENPEHPYAKVGKESIIRSVNAFLKASGEMGLSYAGSLDSNLLMPTAAGALSPTSLYPGANGKDVKKAREMVVVGIKELIDFYPLIVAQNLERQLGKKVEALWVELGLDLGRELNSYDLALTLEQEKNVIGLINKLKSWGVKDKLVLIPAVLGIKDWQQVINRLESQLECQVMEIPTLPPSVMGYRLAQSFMHYLKKKGVEFIIGHPVVHVDCRAGRCREIAIETAAHRLKKIAGEAFCLATGGILGEGLQVFPKGIREVVFNLPVKTAETHSLEDFFSLEEQPLALAGVMTNEFLQPVDVETGEAALTNVFVAGATLAGYDPFLEKSGNGVALATGYRAGQLAAGGGKVNE
ncbi:MAG: anaerobic glycerol-3-phosphate dehydrogenase subunit B [Clostridia bacterium]|nr:anaerobic glycerol-3-phosphate dehydrogenase subunit B [Clostridia bacterium]